MLSVRKPIKYITNFFACQALFSTFCDFLFPLFPSRRPVSDSLLIISASAPFVNPFSSSFLRFFRFFYIQNSPLYILLFRLSPIPYLLLPRQLLTDGRRFNRSFPIVFISYCLHFLSCAGRPPATRPGELPVPPSSSPAQIRGYNEYPAVCANTVFLLGKRAPIPNGMIVKFIFIVPLSRTTSIQTVVFPYAF